MIEEVNEEEEKDEVEQLPDILSLSVKPSPTLRYGLLDIIFAFCYSCRLYNGEWEEEEEFVWLMLQLCQTLSSKSVVYVTKEKSSKLICCSLKTRKC